RHAYRISLAIALSDIVAIGAGLQQLVSRFKSSNGKTLRKDRGRPKQSDRRYKKYFRPHSCLLTRLRHPKSLNEGRPLARDPANKIPRVSETNGCHAHTPLSAAVVSRGICRAHCDPGHR